jgi:hypothetical protein
VLPKLSQVTSRLAPRVPPFSHPQLDAGALNVLDQIAQRVQPGQVDVGDGIADENERVGRRHLLFDEATDRLTKVVRVGEEDRRLEAHDQHALARLGVGMAVDVAMLEHLVRLGVTAVKLLPVHQFVHDRALAARGLRNYWGYQSIGFFAPHNEYGSVEDFKAMVKALHGAGLEVILDVVFNHTAEGSEDGPTLCFRGLADAAYYRLRDDGSYVDDNGCGTPSTRTGPTGCGS